MITYFKNIEMSKLISVTTNEAFRMVKDANSFDTIRLKWVGDEFSFTKEKAKAMLSKHISDGAGAWTVEIYFKGIENVQRKYSEVEDKRRLDLEHSVDVLNRAEDLISGLETNLEVNVLLSRHNGGTRFIYTVYHASRNETALTFGKVISQEIMKSAEQKGILKKVTVFLEENEADEYDPNDEAEQDR